MASARPFKLDPQFDQELSHLLRYRESLQWMEKSDLFDRQFIEDVRACYEELVKEVCAGRPW